MDMGTITWYLRREIAPLRHAWRAWRECRALWGGWVNPDEIKF